MTTPSVHPYSLRARTGKAAAKKGPTDAASTSDKDIPNPTGALSTGRTTRRRYSDVVSGHESPELQGGPVVINKSGDEGSTFKDLDRIDKGNESDEPSLSPDQNLNRWVHDNPNLKLVFKKANLARKDKPEDPNEDEYPNREEDTRLQDPVVEAEKQLTTAQKERIERRYRNVARKQLRSTSPASRGEGPSKSKGKGADPANWGNAGLDEEELDPEVQQAALDSLKQSLHTRKAERTSRDEQRGKKTVRHVSDSVRGGPASQTPAPSHHWTLPNTRKGDIQPINQIPANSYIGQTLKNIHRLGTRNQRSGNDPSSSSSSDSSDSSSEPNDSDDDVSADQKKSLARRRRSRSKGKRRSKRLPKSGLKPIPPERI
ncbi:hypothetical protein M413DRAFT_23065 [Hebeloma cylindrosporum]|uniref:Uncharacterized protein n=1 Tax=Hebeloma cylindrosporum TaxID=76867 RepID=A0A0C3CD48_HEBCY|nr:hypothetical protein M413DRAFT_23065 [Hebeloma cylindrosporum h7]